MDLKFTLAALQLSKLREQVSRRASFFNKQKSAINWANFQTARRFVLFLLYCLAKCANLRNCRKSVELQVWDLKTQQVKTSSAAFFPKHRRFPKKKSFLNSKKTRYSAREKPSSIAALMPIALEYSLFFEIHDQASDPRAFQKVIASDSPVIVPSCHVRNG